MDVRAKKKRVAGRRIAQCRRSCTPHSARERFDEKKERKKNSLNTRQSQQTRASDRRHASTSMTERPSTVESMAEAAYAQCVSKAERKWQERRDEDRAGSMWIRLRHLVGVETLAEQSRRKWSEFEKRKCLAAHMWNTR